MGRNRKRPNEYGQWQCTFCYKWKDPDQFYQSGSNSNGLQSRCIDCMRISQAANHLVNNTSGVYLETYFPFAEDEELEDFIEVLKEWKKYPASSRAGKIMADNVREWLTFFEAQNPNTNPLTKTPQKKSSRRTKVPETTEAWATPGTATKVGGYEVTFVGPPVPDSRPGWWTLLPSEMTDAQYEDWSISGQPDDPAERA